MERIGAKVGSIRHRGNNRWEVRVSAGFDVTGKRQTRSRVVTAADEADAYRQAARIAVVYERELRTRRPPQSVAVLLERWYTATESKRQARSNETVRANLDQHLLPAMGDWSVGTVDVGRLEQLYLDLAHDKGLADGTIRHLHYIVRPAFALAVRWGWLVVNPAAGVDLGPLRQRNVRPPSAEVVAALVAAAGEDLGCFLRLAAVTGARRSELAALRWGDVDWMDATVTIAVALSRPRSGLELKATKTARGQRSIGVDFDTLRVLEEQRSRNVAAGAADHAAAWVFPDLANHITGTIPIPPATWTHRFNLLRQRVPGAERVRLHDLRHFAATALLAEGVPVTAVSALLGHARTSTTSDTYALWASRGADPKLAESLARRLSPPE